MKWSEAERLLEEVKASTPPNEPDSKWGSANLWVAPEGIRERMEAARKRRAAR